MSEKAALTQWFLACKPVEYAALKEQIEALVQQENLRAVIGPTPRANK